MNEILTVVVLFGAGLAVFVILCGVEAVVDYLKGVGQGSDGIEP